MRGHRQQMWIMDVVWPLTTLWSGPIGLYFYFKVDRLGTRHAVQRARQRGEAPPSKRKPFVQTAGVAASHCGAGCTLGDLLTEWFVFFVPLPLFGRKIVGAWVLDFAVAFLLGIVFQYFTIQPMRSFSPARGIAQAIKADTFSITAWQVGMYGWMAIATFGIFGHELAQTGPVFWFMMQIAMFAGFATAFPVNWLLLRCGVKEAM